MSAVRSAPRRAASAAWGRPCSKRLEGRLQGVDHRPVAELRAADLLQPGETGGERVAHGQAARGGVAGGGEEDREQDAGRAADGLAELLADGAVELGVVGERQAVHAGEDGAGGGRQRRAGVAVAGLGVEGVEVASRRRSGSRSSGSGRRGSPGGRRAGAGSAGGRPAAATTFTAPSRLRPGQAASGVGASRAREVLRRRRVDRDREAAHLERGHQRRRADDVAEAAGDRGAGELVGEHRHLEDRGAAEVVEDGDVRAVAPSAGRGGRRPWRWRCGRRCSRPARCRPRRGCRGRARPCPAGCAPPWASPGRCRCRATCRWCGCRRRCAGRRR